MQSAVQGSVVNHAMPKREQLVLLAAGIVSIIVGT